MITLIIGIALFSLGFLLYSQTTEGETEIEKTIFDERTLTTSKGLAADFVSEKKTIQWRENTTPPIVTGSISEHTGNKCNFYIFDPANFRLWKDNRNYDEAFVEGNQVESLDFQFNPDTDNGSYYFVVFTPEPSQTRVAILSATLKYEGIRTKRPHGTVGNFLIILGGGVIFLAFWAAVPFPSFPSYNP